MCDLYVFMKRDVVSLFREMKMNLLIELYFPKRFLKASFTKYLTYDLSSSFLGIKALRPSK